MPSDLSTIHGLPDGFQSFALSNVIRCISNKLILEYLYGAVPNLAEALLKVVRCPTCTGMHHTFLKKPTYGKKGGRKGVGVGKHVGKGSPDLYY